MGAPGDTDSEQQWAARVKEQLNMEADDGQTLNIGHVKKVFQLRENFFAERLFTLLDSDGNGELDLKELMDGIELLTAGEPEKRLRFLFNIYDVNGDGSVEFSELKSVLQSSVKESAMTLSEDDVNELASTLFDGMDEDNSGEVTFDEIITNLKSKHPTIIENLTMRSLHNWLKPKKKTKNRCETFFKNRIKKIKNNLKMFSFCLIFFVVNVGLFCLSAIRYRDFNWCVIIARGCGMCLNFDCAFILVCVLRQCLTWLRNSFVSQYLPLDDNIYLHKLTGLLICLFGGTHTLAHLGNIGYITSAAHDANSSVPKYWEFLFTLESHVGYVGPGFSYLSGIILLVVLAIMILCSLPCVRMSGHFEVFYWTHFLYFVFWTTLILHGPIFWYFLVGPAVLFIFEKLLHSRIGKHLKHGEVFIEEVRLLPSRVTQLVIRRPASFHYHPGDYMHINIPAIAQYEWHPFTISSAPEMPDQIWFHVRSVGHWTNKLYDFFDNYASNVDTFGHKVKRNAKPRAKGAIQPNDSMFVNKAFSSEESSVIGTSYVQIDMIDTSQVDTNQNDPIQTHTNLVDANNVDTNQIDTNQIDLNQIDPNQTDTNHVGANQIDQYDDDPNKIDLNQTDSNRIERNQKLPMKNHLQVKEKKVKIQVHLQGSYGTSTREIFESEHVVLICSGIGVTPYAAILQSIMYQYNTRRRQCPSCNQVWFDNNQCDVMKLKKVNFIWINRDQKCFEWFISILAQLETQQDELAEEEHLLDMELYMTSAHSRDDMTGMALQLALEILYEKKRRDILTGLRTRTLPGKPNWDKVFTNISDHKKGPVKVFFCGNPVLGKAIKEKCLKYRFSFDKEHF